mmetsp:Transcript_83292/g.102071  ORF Transcript_83292/g.102071 Transcript_83292/m.102071 type:complete len:380 (-) Transcript_83292:76-1215(-)
MSSKKRLQKVLNHLKRNNDSNVNGCSNDISIDLNDSKLNTKKLNILITSNFYPCTPRIYDVLTKNGHNVTLLKPTDSMKKYTKILLNHLKNVRNDYDGILNAWTLKLDKDTLKLMPKLKIVSCISAGFNNVDIQYCKDNGIRVTNISPSLAETVADYVVGLILVTCRNIVNSANILRAKGVKIAKDPEYFPAFGFARGTKDLYLSKVGIIGLGNIGKQTAKRLRFGFGCQVFYYQPLGRVKNDTKFGAKYISSLDELYKTCDIIVPLCPLLKSTKGMFNKETFKKMGKNSIIVNAARGGLIVTNDLLNALKNGDILGAGLDVTDPEPLPNNHELYTLNNCTIVPHIGSATEQCRNRMLDMATHNLLTVLHGFKCTNIVV